MLICFHKPQPAYHMRKFLLTISVLALVQLSFSQSVVKGKVSDTLEKRNLSNAVVSLLRKSDSTLFKFSRTNKDGEFSVPNVLSGKYLLLVTYPKFVDYADEIDVNGPDKDLGIIPLTLQSQLMNEVVIRQNIAIRIKGDTIEYKADSFKVAEGASVKDLLKKLPGMQVDKNGQITAQGEKVNKVLVDGEEFFSDDPAVVIENLRADAVDKVQSFDKKSDQAEFTGVDDGQKSKTLNLVLKDDKKKGYLGKVLIGGGTSERYSEQAMLNYFKGKKKISIYGIASNVGQTGLGWEDRSKFGEGSDFGDAEVEVGAGFIMINSSGNDNDFSDWQNSYRDEGLPRSIKAGAHVSNKWNADKQSFNGNYSLKDLKVDAEGNSFTKTFFRDSAILSNENHSSISSQRQQLFNGTYDLKLDSLSSLRFKFNGKIQNDENYTFTNTETDNDNFEKLNTNSRINTTNGDSKIFLGSVLWRQKFKRKGRTISLSLSYKNSDKNSDGFLNSATSFFNNGVWFRTDSINQYKTNNTTTRTGNSKLVYTEPAGKKGIFEFNYTLNDITSNSDRKSFDRVNGKYESLNLLYSNRYQLDYLSNSAGAKYQYNGKKVTANIGTNIGVSNYEQKDSLGKQVRQLNYTNLFPTARITYRFAAQKGLTFNYSGSPQAPTVEQVQPIAENTNPLYKTIGNPLLQQAFRHNLSVMFNDFKTLTGRSIWINGSFNSTDNAIVSNQTVVNGITTTQFVNASGNYSYYFYGSYNTKIKKPDMNIGFSLNTNGSRYVNFLAGKKNFSHQRTMSGGFDGSKYKENKYEIWLRTSFEYTISVSAKNKLANEDNSKTHYWGQSHNGGANFYFTKRLNIGTDADFTYNQKTSDFAKDNVFTIWNANVSYKIFKNRNGVFKFEINDILKQKRGYNRSAYSNSISERYYNTLGRYAMLSFTWNFTKTPGTPTPTK
jgi:hypothetical protein